MLGNLRHSLAGAALLLLGACSSSSSSDNNYAQFYQLIKQSLAASFGKVKITREQAAAIPYASIGYSVNGGNQKLLILATDSGGDLLWTSPSHVVIVTRDGRIIRTVGLGNDLSAFTVQGGSLPPPSAAVLGAYTRTRLEDFPKLGLYGVTATCRTRFIGQQKIDILGQSIQTDRIEEACRSHSPDWSFQDTYWIDPENGLVWLSRQHLNPKGDIVETEILRPPG